MLYSPRLQSRVALALSVLLYCLCLSQAGICIQGLCEEWTPAGMLIFGYLELFHRSSWGAGVTWLANPLLFASWILTLLAAYRWAFVVSLCALPMALLLLMTRTVVASASALPQTVTGFAPGYWLWIAALTVAALSAALGHPALVRRRRPTAPVGRS